MKKILLILMTLAVTGLTADVLGQLPCTGGASNCALAVSNAAVTLQTANPLNNNTQCEVVFTVEFDLSYNSGNKDIFISAWLASQYTQYFPCGTGSGGGGTMPAPDHTRLGTAVDDATPGKSFLDIGLDNGANRGAAGVPVVMPIYTTYNADPLVILTSGTNSPGMNATKTFISGTTDRVRIENIHIIINQSCAAALSVMVDVWSRNGANSPAQCWISGLGQLFNDPTVSLIKSCTSSPFTYDIGISTISPTNRHVVYRLYAHDPLLGEDPLPGDPVIYTSDTIIIKSGSPYDPAPINLPDGYCCVAPWAYWGIYAKVTSRASESSNSISTFVDYGSACATLPIKLRSFDANRNKSNVDLKWITEIEDNNKGFYVERMLSYGGWQTITFVASQAPNGNSTSPLTYTLTDFNNTKGISQYRLRQMDIDGKQAYSQIRSVRGEGQKSNTIIYPNPSGDGKVSIVFEGANSTRDVSLMDVSGKTLKQWKGVTNNNIQIDNLNTGFYTVRIVNVETGEQVVEKFIVNKR